MNKRSLVVIVGPGKDLGYELARKFGMDGYDIVFMGRDSATIKLKMLPLAGEGIKINFIPIDLTNEKSITDAFIEVDKLNQPVCGLIYNAVVRRIKTPSEITAEEVADDLKVNFLGAVSCTAQILRRYKRAGNEFMMYTGGGVALTPSVPFASMSVGKAALHNYVLNLAEEFKDKAIYIGTVLITQKIQYGTKYAPDLIAGTYLKMIRTKEAVETVI